jgi:hypothetical protein
LRFFAAGHLYLLLRWFAVSLIAAVVVAGSRLRAPCRGIEDRTSSWEITRPCFPPPPCCSVVALVVAVVAGWRCTCCYSVDALPWGISDRAWPAGWNCQSVHMGDTAAIPDRDALYQHREHHQAYKHGYKHAYTH